MHGWFFFLILASTSLQAMGDSTPAENQELEPGEELSGGATTVFDDTRNAYSLAARNLSDERRPAFFVGNSFFNQNWVAAPSSTKARDGLGPLFNARSCSACHFKDGRSRPPDDHQPMSTMLLRISVPGQGQHGGPKPDETYGDQIQGAGTGRVPAEAEVLVHYRFSEGHFADGETFSLREPAYTLTNLGYGAVSAQLLMSGRVAPPMIGLGLLEAVPEETLRALADPEDENRDGISGRLNRVWNEETQRMAVGRFGWKAGQPSLRQQVAGAFLGDLGLTTSLFSRANHTARQAECAHEPNGGEPEVSDKILGDVVFYSHTLAVPARRQVNHSGVVPGRQLFARIGCAACHVPRLQTGEVPDFPELSRQTIRPYSDLLLHDLGEGLADHRPEFAASGSEWRTPPLWGIGLLGKVNEHTFLLHDGRARNLAEAILWHGGEAEPARERFRQMPKADRAALLAFLESL